jgi:hypothetical protein
MNLKIYSFTRDISQDRFDYSCIRHLIDHLTKKNYKIEWENLDGNDKFIYKNDCNVLINQGSICIFEFDNKTFKVWDCGDKPNLSLEMSKSKNFIGAAIGQYNKTLWDENVKDPNIRNEINKGVHFESFWQFGVSNYEDVNEYRRSKTLNNKLLWRGSLYENCPERNEYKGRQYISLLNDKLNGNFQFGNYPIHFDYYIKESIEYKLVLCSGVGGGYSCGDYCFRDGELYGLGIPTLRPKYAIETYIPLIPDYHYISVDAEFDEKFKYKNHGDLADKITKRYNEVIHDNEYLDFISNNARQWYMDMLSYPNVINNIIESLKL